MFEIIHIDQKTGREETLCYANTEEQAILMLNAYIDYRKDTHFDHYKIIEIGTQIRKVCIPRATNQNPKRENT